MLRSYIQRERACIGPHTQDHEALALAVDGSVEKATAGTSFCWSSIQIDNNTISREYHNASNAGLSLSALFGKFAGGFFVSRDCGVRSNDVNVWHAFDGTCPHSSTPLNGISFSVVVFYHKMGDMLGAKGKRRLKKLGFRLPTDQALPASSSERSGGPGDGEVANERASRD